MAEIAFTAFVVSLLSLLGAGAVNVLTVAWPAALGTAGGAALLSVLKSIASAPVGVRGTNFIVPGGR